jgi:transcriptional regulator with XRE-family HTH domain
VLAFDDSSRFLYCSPRIRILSKLAYSNSNILLKKQVVNGFLYPTLFIMKSKPEPIRLLLSKNIKKYRGVLHFSQEKLAEKAGLSSQTLNDIEGCRRWLSSKTISKLAKTLKVSEYQLLLPEKADASLKPVDSSLKSLIALQERIKNDIDVQFEEAIDTGNFK